MIESYIKKNTGKDIVLSTDAVAFWSYYVSLVRGIRSAKEIKDIFKIVLSLQLGGFDGTVMTSDSLNDDALDLLQWTPMARPEAAFPDVLPRSGYIRLTQYPLAGGSSEQSVPAVDYFHLEAAANLSHVLQDPATFIARGYHAILATECQRNA